MGRGGQIFSGALLFVFGLMVLLGLLDWLVRIMGGLTMVVGIIMVAMAMMGGGRRGNF